MMDSNKKVGNDVNGATFRRGGGSASGRGGDKQRGLEESCKSLIVSTLMEERKEEEDNIPQGINLPRP